MSVAVEFGPDHGGTLQGVWETIETHAEPLERLCQQQAKITMKILEGGLAVQLPLVQPFNNLRLILEKEKVRYVLVRGNDLIEVEPKTRLVDQGVYLVLAELAAKNG